jgi:hypothetical protein
VPKPPASATTWLSQAEPGCEQVVGEPGEAAGGDLTARILLNSDGRPFDDLEERAWDRRPAAFRLACKEEAACSSLPVASGSTTRLEGEIRYVFWRKDCNVHCGPLQVIQVCYGTAHLDHDVGQPLGQFRALVDAGPNPMLGVPSWRHLAAHGSSGIPRPIDLRNLDTEAQVVVKYAISNR